MAAVRDPRSSGSLGSTRSPARRVLGYTALTVFALLFLGPFAIQIATAFKTDPDATGNPLSLVPHPPTAEAWKRIFGYSVDQPVPFGTWLRNSIIVSTCITLLRVFLDSLAGYALARLKFPGRRAVFALILATLAVPSVVLLIPRFLVLKELHLYNSYAGMILPIAMDAMGIFLMRGFFMQVPLSIEEAARIDGAGTFRTYE
jgi:multiple sugar transport system permease protein